MSYRSDFREGQREYYWSLPRSQPTTDRADFTRRMMSNIDGSHDVEIATLKARIEKLERALGPFARFADRFGETAREDDWQITNNPSGKGNLTMGDCRGARAVLKPKAES